jgi:pimeloyl-ACP methyl ester carboxylesterase
MKIPKIRFVGLFLIVFTLLSVQLIFAQPAKIVTETIMVPASDPGIQLHVRNKHPEGVSNFGTDRIVLFVHGVTYSSESAFDLPLNGLSWMDYVAQRGWDVYIMDLRGYGRSTRPSEMSKPAAENPPIGGNTDVAVKDVGAVVDYILARRGVQRLNLLGWSWGANIMGGYTAQNNAKVERLIFYAPLWFVKDAPPIGGTGPLGAYRTVKKEEAKKRMVRGVAPEKQKELLPDDWFDAWWEATLRPDPVGAGQNPPVVRAPNGTLEDLRKYSMSGKPYYDAANITAPTLVIVAEWDAEAAPYMAEATFANLKNTPIKRMVMIGEGTHWVFMEKNRLQLFREVQLFLEEPK